MGILEQIGFLQASCEMEVEDEKGTSWPAIPSDSYVRSMLDFLDNYFSGKILNSGECKFRPPPPRLY